MSPRSTPSRRKSYSARGHDTAARRRLVFGVDELGEPAKEGKLVEVGWHPVCGHIRHVSTNDRLVDTPSPALIYGLVARREINARLADCDTCRPPAQAELPL